MLSICFRCQKQSNYSVLRLLYGENSTRNVYGKYSQFVQYISTLHNYPINIITEVDSVMSPIY